MARALAFSGHGGITIAVAKVLSVQAACVLVHEVTREEKLAELRRMQSADHAGLEAEKHRAGHALAALGLVVKHVDAVELRIVVAAVLAVAADAVYVNDLQKQLGAHLVTALARLHVHNLARRISLVAGSTREKKNGEERRLVGNSDWKSGTGKRKCRCRARVHPERENRIDSPL